MMDLYNYVIHYFILVNMMVKIISTLSTENPSRILNGYPSNRGEFPWMAAIYVKFRYNCAGAVITENHIISAGHCFLTSSGYKPSTQDVTVGLGNILLRSFWVNLSFRQVKVIDLYPTITYATVHGITVPLNDIAILTMKMKIQFSSDIQPISLPVAGELYVNHLGTIAGWGATNEEGSTPNDHLLYTMVKIIEYKICLRSPISIHFSRHLDLDTILCAFGGNADGCKGDSGGPLLVKSSTNTSVLVGIMSWGIGCGNPLYPGVYTRTGHFIDWIESIINES